MARASTPRGLFFRKHHRAFLFATMPEVQRHSIRRVYFEKMIEALSEQTALQALPEHIGREDVWNLLQEIAGVLLPFCAHAKFAQTIHPAPYRRARHPDFARDACATHDDRGVFG